MNNKVIRGVQKQSTSCLHCSVFCSDKTNVLTMVGSRTNQNKKTPVVRSFV